MSSKPVHIIGAGLAGSEAAYFLSQRGVKVFLHEMRPQRMTPAHKTEKCAELVCSNSFKSLNPESAPGILKQEMRALKSLMIDAALSSQVPGGEALTVDREQFSNTVTQKLQSQPHIERCHGEVSKPFEREINLIATGPLTSESLTEWLVSATDSEDLYFYDAIAPVVDATSINFDKVFIANRYDKGEEEAYINCPFTKEQYEAFIDALLSAEKVAPKNFEKEKFYQGCQPIEAIAEGGRESLRFGPMKPVGLTDPRTGKMPYAVLQLRPENLSKTAYNMVGFQTKLKYPEQKKIFQMIPGLETAEFFRWGSIHRNTYLCGPKVLRPDLSLKGNPQVYLAGQITGVEGYLESAACGLLAGIFIYQKINQQTHTAPPANTALGALLRYVTAGNVKNYQPSGMNFSLLEPIFFENTEALKRNDLRKEISRQSIQNLNQWQSRQYWL